MARVIEESSRIDDLNAGIMFAIERRMSSRAASLRGVIRIVEPKAEMIELHRVDRDPICFLGEDCGRAMENVR
jgi:hypothetical protein